MGKYPIQTRWTDQADSLSDTLGAASSQRFLPIAQVPQVAGQPVNRLVASSQLDLSGAGVVRVTANNRHFVDRRRQETESVIALGCD